MTTPAVFVEEGTGNLLFHGWTVTDAAPLAGVSRHSPVVDSESVVRLSASQRSRSQPDDGSWTLALTLVS
jgi:hypothetical protein